MLKESVTPQEVCDLLNSLLKTDREFITNIMKTHIPCNKKVAEHPTVQVRGYKDYPDSYTCDILGILNGLFGIQEDGMGAICYLMDDASEKITEFKITPGGLK